MRSSLSVLCLCAILVGVQSSEWSYFGAVNPGTWAKHFTGCAGAAQSPINIDSTSVMDISVDSLNFQDYDLPLIGSLVNNGHSIQFNPDNSSTQIMSGGALPAGETYQFAQLHFHWGNKPNKGSEHTVDGIQFPLEMHMVHINTKYVDNTTAALEDPLGLAVVGIFYTLSGNQESFLPMTEIDQSAIGLLGRSNDNTAEVTTTLTLQDFLDAVDQDSYYSYQGSLTTPSCNEVVSWIVMQDPIAIQPNQIVAFRKQLTEEHKHLVNNFRPVQPLNGRTVSRVGGGAYDY